MRCDGINKRLSSLSSDKASFDKAAPPYQKALDEGGYQYTLRHEPTTTAKRRNRQQNNILWYNPPFNKNVSNNIGHKFLSLIDKHFPKDHSLRKIFNRNSIKISYSCMNNTKQIIDNHNKRILHSATADKRTIARSTVTAFDLQSFIKPPSHGTTITPLKHTLDSQKSTSKQDTEITSHHSATPSTKTLPNLANTSGHSRTITSTIPFHGASYHLALPTTAPVKDATSA